jgi:hypothetical protein
VIPRKRIARALVVVASVLCMASVAIAQPRRIDDGLPNGPIEIGSGWTMVSIPNLPAGTSLGALWTDASGTLYVWAVQKWLAGPVPMQTEGGERTDPGVEPDPTSGNSVPPGRSVLYRWDGAVWTPALEVMDFAGTTVYGTGTRDVYAAGVTLEGAVELYHWDGVAWSREALPIDHGVPGALVGSPGDLYFRVSDRVLHFDGKSWGIVLTQPHLAMGRGLVYVSPTEVYARCCKGQWFWNGAQWSWDPAGDMIEPSGAWGTRAPDGSLTMFATGCAQTMNGIHIWRFTESAPGCGTGTWSTAVCSPGIAGFGNAERIWGSGPDDIFVIGRLERNGVILHWNGRDWSYVHPDLAMPIARDVWGQHPNDVWISLADGRLMHKNAPNRDPEVTAATAAYTLPWPPHGHWMPVEIRDVVDPDGDFLTIRVTGVTQDEPFGDKHWHFTCPDARIDAAGRVEIRAEREPEGNGRVYAIAFTAVDSHGATREGQVEVCIPRHRGDTCIDDGQTVNSLGPCTGKCGGKTLAVQPATEADHGLRIRFALAGESDVLLAVYDVGGRRVATLRSGRLDAGEHEVAWSTTGLAAGVYFCGLRTADGMETRRILVTP